MRQEKHALAGKAKGRGETTATSESKKVPKSKVRANTAQGEQVPVQGKATPDTGKRVQGEQVQATEVVKADTAQREQVAPVQGRGEPYPGKEVEGEQFTATDVAQGNRLEQEAGIGSITCDKKSDATVMQDKKGDEVTSGQCDGGGTGAIETAEHKASGEVGKNSTKEGENVRSNDGGGTGTGVGETTIQQGETQKSDLEATASDEEGGTQLDCSQSQSQAIGQRGTDTSTPGGEAAIDLQRAENPEKGSPGPQSVMEITEDESLLAVTSPRTIASGPGAILVEDSLPASAQGGEFQPTGQVRAPWVWALFIPLLPELIGGMGGRG